jgi:hypothetical protein
MCQYEKIEQLPPYFECTAALGASTMSLEQQKNAKLGDSQ